MPMSASAVVNRLRRAARPGRRGRRRGARQPGLARHVALEERVDLLERPLGATCPTSGSRFARRRSSTCAAEVEEPQASSRGSAGHRLRLRAAEARRPTPTAVETDVPRGRPPSSRTSSSLSKEVAAVGGRRHRPSSRTPSARRWSPGPSRRPAGVSPVAAAAAAAPVLGRRCFGTSAVGLRHVTWAETDSATAQCSWSHEPPRPASAARARHHASSAAARGRMRRDRFTVDRRRQTSAST